MMYINYSQDPSSEHLHALACPTLRMTGSDAHSLWDPQKRLDCGINLFSQHACCPDRSQYTSHLCGSMYNNQNLQFILTMCFYGHGVEIIHDLTRFTGKSVMS